MNYYVTETLRKFMFGGLFIFLSLFLFSQAKAQYNCAAFNLSAPNSATRLNGIWKIEHTNNAGTLHTTILTMKGWGGVSITSYYDTTERRTRNIAQNHLLCVKNSVIVILGYVPFDSDTGEKVTTYGADNFFLIQDSKGNLLGRNNDDNDNGSALKITFLSNLNTPAGTTKRTRTRKTRK